MRILRDEDADFGHLRDRRIAIVGYGNQGRAQALNLRDSGAEVIVGSIADASAAQAEKDGFGVCPIGAAVDAADAVALLIPDEVQRDVYRDDVEPRLRAGHVLDFAHGYNVHFGLIRPPAFVDVILVAPRMIGVQVRQSFERGAGVPAYVAVAQDASGRARDLALAWAKGIGATRAGVIETTFAAETELDLFAEQAVWPIIVRDLLLSYEVLVEAGFAPEMVALELYGSGEAAEIFRQMARVGVVRQMRLHSQTSQYGTLSRGATMLPEETRTRMRAALDGIRCGRFAREWSEEQEHGYPTFTELRRAAEAHDINRAEVAAREMVARSEVGEDASSRPRSSDPLEIPPEGEARRPLPREAGEGKGGSACTHPLPYPPPLRRGGDP
jgi:ketol-acid reductoisomerase